MSEKVYRVPQKGMKSQVFFATVGQTDFVVTDFRLNDFYLVSTGGATTTQGHSRVNNTVTFVVPRLALEEIIIYN